MEYFGVELHAPELFAVGAVGCDGYFVGGGYGVEVGGDLGDGIALAHPYLGAWFYVFKQGVGVVDEAEVGAAVFA